MISHALHLSIFEQPSPIDFFNTLLEVMSRHMLFVFKPGIEHILQPFTEQIVAKHG